MCYDGLNVADLQCIELICRRCQLLADAHANSPGAPSYLGAEHYLEETYRMGGGIVVPAPTDQVSRKNASPKPNTERQTETCRELGTPKRRLRARRGAVLPRVCCPALACAVGASQCVTFVFMPLHSSFWGSSIFHEPCPDSRIRDVFPLPLLDVQNPGLCRATSRRLPADLILAEASNEPLAA